MAKDTQQPKAEAVENVVLEAPEGAEVPKSIGLNDLQLLANIVDLDQRGAFRGNELTQVGAVFDKLAPPQLCERSPNRPLRRRKC